MQPWPGSRSRVRYCMRMCNTCTAGTLGLRAFALNSRCLVFMWVHAVFASTNAHAPTCIQHTHIRTSNNARNGCDIATSTSQLALLLQLAMVASMRSVMSQRCNHKAYECQYERSSASSCVRTRAGHTGVCRSRRGRRPVTGSASEAGVTATCWLANACHECTRSVITAHLWALEWARCRAHEGALQRTPQDAADAHETFTVAQLCHCNIRLGSWIDRCLVASKVQPHAAFALFQFTLCVANRAVAATRVQQRDACHGVSWIVQQPFGISWLVDVARKCRATARVFEQLVRASRADIHALVRADPARLHLHKAQTCKAASELTRSGHTTCEFTVWLLSTPCPTMSRACIAVIPQTSVPPVSQRS